MSTTPAKTTHAKTTLFDLTAEALDIKRRIDELAEETGGEISEDGTGSGATEAAFDALLDELAASEEALRSKAEAYLHVAAELEAEAEAEVARSALLLERAGHVQARAERKRRARARILGRLQEAMELLGIDRLDAGLFHPTLQGKGGLPPVELTAEPDHLPCRFLRSEVRLRFNLGRVDALARKQLTVALEALAETARVEERIEPDTAALRDALRSGEGGAEEFARFAPRGRRLVIK